MVGVTQATVCRWETGEIKPSLAQLATIRSEALRRNLAWSDSWFFEEKPAMVGLS